MESNQKQRDDESAARFEVRATAESHFSWIRTRLSSERTLMSYNRTAIALIGFGFTLYQFLSRLNIDKTVAPAMYPNAPQHLALLLIGAGLLFLGTGAWSYYSLVGYLHDEQFSPIAGVGSKRWKGGSIYATVLLAITGGCAFGAVLFRI